MISKKEVLMGRDIEFKDEYTQEISDNIDKLLIALNIIRKAYGKPMSTSSGWRPAGLNKAVGGAKKSNHMLGLACDFRDLGGELDEWCMKNLDVLAKAGLYLEHPDYTKGWCHLQLAEPRSKNRVFKP